MWGNWFTEYYLKSEADKVIAEKDKEIEELKHQRDGAFGLTNSGLTLDDLSQMARKQIDYQKYKRCLAMASTCTLRARWFGDNSFYKKEQWALKWHKRWLELAERFKEAS